MKCNVARVLVLSVFSLEMFGVDALMLFFGLNGVHSNYQGPLPSVRFFIMLSLSSWSMVGSLSIIAYLSAYSTAVIAPAFSPSIQN